MFISANTHTYTQTFQSVTMGSELDDLHGMVPDKHHTALLLIDVINQLDFEGNEGSIESNK